MSSNLAVEEPMAADPAMNSGGDELREESSDVKSSEKIEIRVSTETIVEEKTTVVDTETKVELTGSEQASEDKSTSDLQVNDLLETKDVESGSMGDVEEGNDPTEISLHDLTGGLDIDGKPTEVEMEEVVMEASVDNETDLVPSSTETAEETNDRLVNSSDEQIEVPESGPTGEVLDQQKLEGSGSVVKEAGSLEKSQKDKTSEEAGECVSEKELGVELEKEKWLVDGDGAREFSAKAAAVGQKEEVAYDTANRPNVDEGLTVEENEEVKRPTSDSCIDPMNVGIEHRSVEIPEQVTGGEQPDNVVLHTHTPMDIDGAVNSEITEVESLMEAGWDNQKLMAEVGADKETSQYGERSTDNEELPDYSLGQNNIVQGITHVDGKEAVVYHRREKSLTVRNATLSPEPQKEETIPGDIHITYNLPSVEKDGFAISDLVWGKVKSHPWWPGVIISPSDGSNLAMKFKKKDAFLVAYFGDKTFAWCDESQLKPFFPNFSHFEKQATTDAFSNAVRSVLVEVCRRFEVGMICPCPEKKQFAKKIYPKLENAGVRQGFDNCAVDRYEIVNYFNPKGLVDFIKDLALVPTKGTTDRLELVMATSQVKAFYRMKGYPVCPKFQTFGRLEEYIEPVIESSKSEELPEISVMEVQTPPNVTPPVVTPSVNINPVELGVVERPKKKRGRPPKKKKEELDIEVQKPLSELVRRKVHSNLSNGSQSNFKPERTTTDEEDSASPLPWKKRKEVVGFDLVEHENQQQTPRSGGFGISFKIGECISRAASRLTGSGSSPLISTPKFDSADFDVSSDDETPIPATHEEKRVRKRRLKKYQYSDPKDVLSHLCLVASGPTKECSILSTVVSYFTDFRNFTVEPPPVPPSTGTPNLPEKVKSRRGRKRKIDLPVTPFDEVVTPTDHMQDSYWSDMILCGQIEEPSSGLKLRKRRVSIETKHLKLTPGSSEKRALAVAAAATKRPIVRVEEKRLDECNPTALLLSFGTRYGTVPSEMDIVRIFSRYGPLKEWEMAKVEGGTNRVWIVFKRRADAEMAFSNLRTQNVFGPSLVSYRLVYELHENSEPDKKIEVPNGEEHFELKASEETVNLPNVIQGDDATVDLLRNITGVDAHAMLVGPLSDVEGSNVIQGDNVAGIVVDLSNNTKSVDADVHSQVSPSNNVEIVDAAQDNHMDEIPVDPSGNAEDIDVDEMSIDPLSTVQVEAVTEILIEPINSMAEISVDSSNMQIEAVDETSSTARIVAASEAAFEPSSIISNVEAVGDVSITPSGTALDDAAGHPSTNAASTLHVAAVNEVLTNEFGTVKDGSVVVEPTELSSTDEVTVAKSVALSCEVQGMAAALVSVTQSNTIQDSEMVVNKSNTEPSQYRGDSDQPSILHSEVIGDVSIVPASSEEHKLFAEAPLNHTPTEEGKDGGVMPVETNNNEEGEVAGEEAEVVGKILAEQGYSEQDKVADNVSLEPASSEHGTGDGEIPVEPSSTGEGEAVDKMSAEPASPGQNEVAGEVSTEASSIKQGEVIVELAGDPSSTAESDVFGEVPVEPSSTEQVEDGKVQFESAETIQADERPVDPSSPEEGEVVGEGSFEPASTEQGKVVGEVFVEPSKPEQDEVITEVPVEKDGKPAEGSVEKPACTAEQFT